MKRVEWIDSAKGLAIFLVVFLHISGWYSLSRGLGGAFWYDIGQTIQAFRMPLFFTISGLLVTTTLLQNPRRMVAVSLNLYFLYFLWTTLFAMRLLFFSGVADAPEFSLDMLLWGAFSPSSYWYIFALPIYHLVAIFLRRCVYENVLAKLAIVIVAFIVSMSSEPLSAAIEYQMYQHVQMVHLYEIPRNFPWYLIGAFFGPVILQLVARFAEMPRWATILGPVIFVAGWGVAYLQSFDDYIVAPFFMVFGGMVFLSTLNGRWIQSYFGKIGRRTLPVYIFHFFVMNALSLVVVKLGIDTLPAWSSFVTPPLIAVAVVHLCLGLGTLLEKMGLGFLIKGFPSPVTRYGTPQPLAMEDQFGNVERANSPR